MDKTQSIRIPSELYEAIRERADRYGRSIVNEVSHLLSNAIDEDIRVAHKKQREAIKKYAGFIKDLPPGDYSGTIDEVLYGVGKP